jgi:hypothetical protein
MIRAPPVSEATGVIMPENCVAGVIVAIAVPKIAASCVFVKEDMSSPRPVVAQT